MRENGVKKENEIREVRNFECKRESVMFVYELMIRCKIEGKETAEEENQNFNPFTVFLWFLCGNLVCVYIGEENLFLFLFLYLDFFSRVWVFFFFFSLNQKPAMCVLWNVIRFALARYLWDILREFRFGHLRKSSG